MNHRRRRSVLFLPAINPRAIDKARTVAADVIVIDLEDSVSPDAKAEARDGAAAAARDGGFGSRELVLRVNALDTPWGADDCAIGDGFDAVLLPKVASEHQLLDLRRALGEDGPPLWAMIETCAGVLGLPALVAAAGTYRLHALLAGVNDLAKDMRCRPDAARTPLLPALAGIVTAARAHGLAAIDGVCNAIDDAELLAAECAQGAMFGFDGKSLIHPAQIDAANAAFAPSAARIAWAERVVAAFDRPENAERGVVRMDGEMVERLHLDEARAVLAQR